MKEGDCWPLKGYHIRHFSLGLSSLVYLLLVHITIIISIYDDTHTRPLLITNIPSILKWRLLCWHNMAFMHACILSKISLALCKTFIGPKICDSSKKI